jgi:hypothetical protein
MSNAYAAYRPTEAEREKMLRWLSQSGVDAPRSGAEVVSLDGRRKPLGLRPVEGDTDARRRQHG